MTAHDAAARPAGAPSAPVLVAAAVAAVTVAAVPWSDQTVVALPGFLPAWLAVVLTCDLVTAVLLLGRARGGASPRLVVLAAGFLWSSILVVGSALSTPGALSAQAVVADPDVMWWFWIDRHVLPPLCVALALVPWPTSWRFGVAGDGLDATALTDGRAGDDPSREAHSRLVARVVVPVIGLAVGLIVVGVLAPSTFPTVTHRSDGFGIGTQPSDGELAVVAAVNAVAVLAGLVGIRVRHSRSRLEAWALVAAVASLGELVVVMLVEPMYTVGFFAARALGLLASLIVLCFVLRDVFALHRRTAQDAARLERQNSELLEAGKLRDHLVAVVSHEMRTPLAGLQGYLELMGEVGEDDPETSARMLERSWMLTRRLTLLAEDLLAVAAAEHGEFVVIPETVHLSHQLDETAACFPDLDLRIDCPPDLMVRADTLRLQQVLTNLVRNAQKHGAEPVTLTCTANADQVTIRVADSGPGVPRDFVHRLFERYAQGSNRRANGGSGLGLAVVRDLVKAHGGSVRYDLTNPAFVVTLPRRRTDRPLVPEPVTLSTSDCLPGDEPPLTAELLDLPLEIEVDVPDTLSDELSDELADVVSGVPRPSTAPTSALEAFAMLSDENPSPGSPN